LKPWLRPSRPRLNVIKHYEDAGADGVVIFVMPASEREMLAELEQIAAKIIG